MKTELIKVQNPKIAGGYKYYLLTVNEEEPQKRMVGQHLATEQHFKTREEAEQYIDTPQWDMILAFVAEILEIHTEIRHKKDKE